MHRAGIVVLFLAVASCGGTGGAASDSALIVGEWADAEVSTVCITGEEDYGVPGGIAPVQEGVSGLFAVEAVVASGCDATITVETTGSARSATYDWRDPITGAVTSRLFTGATVEGTLSLTGSDRPALTAEIANTRMPPSSWNSALGRPTAASSAPFWKAARPEVCSVLWGWFQTSDEAAVRAMIPGLLLDETTVANLRAEGVIPEGVPGPFPCG